MKIAFASTILNAFLGKRSRFFLIIIFFCLFNKESSAQSISFSEFDLKNGLHVILHADSTIPVVSVSVMYHVGSKNESAHKSGFAHLFEHLLFEGSENIPRGGYTKIVTENGGQTNANTTQDRTFFYDLFPSNQLELGLWLESERMYHPKIDQIGLNTQRDVIKSEKQQHIDNQPYGHFDEDVYKSLFRNHPYRFQPIGSMDDINKSELADFNFFFKNYYGPNNAVLCISGNIDTNRTKKLIDAYFGNIPQRHEIRSSYQSEPDIQNEIIDTTYDSHIQIPAVAIAFKTPGMDSRYTEIFKLISLLLSQGKSSRLYSQMVDKQQDALQILAFNRPLEDYGVYVIGALPNEGVSLKKLLHSLNTQLEKLQTELITEDEIVKIQNQAELNYIDANSYQLGVAENLSSDFLFHKKNTGYINEELKIIKSITPLEIREAAKKYLGRNQRLILYYYPKK